MSAPSSRLCQLAGIEVPLICGAMYPCSNPELVAAVSAAGGLGMVQPLALVYVHGWELAAGLRHIRDLTDRPIGFNVIVETSSRVYLERMARAVDVALAAGVRFFVTALGRPGWVVAKVHAAGGVVFHNVTEARWAAKAAADGVDGLVAVNDRAGGHAGPRTPEALLAELAPFGLPVVCAGGVGSPAAFAAALAAGYDGVQMGTRFIATPECSAHADYKAAIVAARAEDIVLTERITGVPVAVIRTPWLERVGTHAGPLARWLLRGRRSRHWMRAWYSLRSGLKLRRSLGRPLSSRDFLQAGRSVEDISAVEPAGDIVRRYAAAAGLA